MRHRHPSQRSRCDIGIHPNAVDVTSTAIDGDRGDIEYLRNVADGTSSPRPWWCIELRVGPHQPRGLPWRGPCIRSPVARILTSTGKPGGGGRRRRRRNPALGELRPHDQRISAHSGIFAYLSRNARGYTCAAYSTVARAEADAEGVQGGLDWLGYRPQPSPPGSGLMRAGQGTRLRTLRSRRASAADIDVTAEVLPDAHSHRRVQATTHTEVPTSPRAPLIEALMNQPAGPAGRPEPPLVRQVKILPGPTVSLPSDQSQRARTCSACGPFWPCVMSNSTRWFSSRLR